MYWSSTSAVLRERIYLISGIFWPERSPYSPKTISHVGEGSFGFITPGVIMGKHKAIEEKSKLDTKFAQDMVNEVKILNERLKPLAVEFEPFVESLYTKNKWTDQKIFGQEVKHDFQSESSFSLAPIKELIQQTAKAILEGGIGDLLKPPKGESISGDDRDAAAKSAKSVSIDSSADFMVSAAVATISSVLDLFSSKTSGVISQGMTSHRIAPGLMLHAYAIKMKSDVKVSLSEGSLILSGIGYKLIWSAAQANDENSMQFMATVKREMQTLEAALITLQEQYTKALIDPQASNDTINAYEGRIRRVKTALSDLQNDANQLLSLIHI